MPGARHSVAVGEQARVFAAMALCGGVLGAIYDLLGLIRRGRLTALADVLFGLVSAAGIIIAALALETDAFRLYIFIAAAAGLTIYALTIGSIVRKISRFARRIVKKSEIKHKNTNDDAGE